METRSRKNKHKQTPTYTESTDQENQDLSEDDDSFGSKENSLHEENRQPSPDFQMDEKGNICAVSFDKDVGGKRLTPAVDILKALYEISLANGQVSSRTLKKVEATLKRYPKK